MNEKTAVKQTVTSKRGRKHLILFVCIIIIAVAFVQYLQRRGPRLEGWTDRLDAALNQGRRENRPLLVFFMGSVPGATARRLAGGTLEKSANREAIADGRFIKVKVMLSSASELAGRYKITELPTMVLLSPEGNELNRRSGFIGEVPFRRGFLDCKDVRKP